MNNRTVPDNMWKTLLDIILVKIEKAEAKDTFYTCMALGRAKISPDIIKSDIYYTLYLNAARHIKDFDLY